MITFLDLHCSGRAQTHVHLRTCHAVVVSFPRRDKPVERSSCAEILLSCWVPTLTCSVLLRNTSQQRCLICTSHIIKRLRSTEEDNIRGSCRNKLALF